MNEQVNKIPNEVGGYDYYCTECGKKFDSACDLAYSQQGSKQLICGDCWTAGKRFKE
jgi:hypothetical protein